MTGRPRERPEDKCAEMHLGREEVTQIPGEMHFRRGGVRGDDPKNLQGERPRERLGE